MGGIEVPERIRSHLSYANVMATLAVFLVLGGGTAMAAYVVSSNSQIGPGTISGHKPPSNKHANIIANSINGKDIADRSGVDTCQTPLVGKFGPICAGSDAGSRTWTNAMKYCMGFGLRLPSPGEATALAAKYDVPGVSATQYFWTDNEFQWTGGTYAATVFNDDGEWGANSEATAAQTVCVTDPSA
jgi:hypothetical protein